MRYDKGQNIGESIVVTEVDLDNDGNLAYIDINISLSKEHLINGGVNALYNPIFDEIKKLERLLEQQGYINKGE